MVVKMDTDLLMGDMKEFCTSFLNQSAFKELREMIEQFATDTSAIEQYEQFENKHRLFSEKELQGLELQQDEIDEYNKDEQKLYENDLIRRFLYAQQELNKAQQLINEYFIKAVELQRIPELHELKTNSSCGCGGACGS